MRYFIGLDLKAHEKLAVDAWRTKALPSFTKSVPAQNFHVTLAFLGDVTQTQMESLVNQLDSLSHDSVDLLINTMGYWSKPRILFLGTTQAHASLSGLAEIIRGVCHRAGIRLQKQEYQPHITIVRGIKQNPPCALFDPEFPLRFSQFHLFESVSTRTGVQYLIRKTWELRPRFAHQI